MILNKSFKLFSFLFLSLVLLKFDVHWKLFIFRYLVHSGRHDVRDHCSMILILTTFQVRTTVSSVVEVSCLIISKRKLFEISFVWPKKVILEKINTMSYCHHLVSVVFNLLLFLWNHRIWEFEFVFLVFNVTFSNISAISWWPILVVEEARVPGENHRPWASNW